MKEPDQSPGPARGSWKPVLTLLFLSPAIGELLSGSSPPLQFFNPVALALLVALYGCGALLIREAVARRSLNSNGLLMLGAAYGIIEEGLTCKSFFNPNWTDTGFLSIYGRAWGVNWVWAVGLTVYHMVVSIMVPIFLTEALFSSSAAGPWLRRRGQRIAAAALALVTVLGFWGFDNRQFHITEIKQPLVLARIDPSPDRLWRRGLLAVGVITPWILFAFVLGIFVGMTGSKSFSGMVAVASLFGFGILALALRWRRRLMGTAVHPVSAGQI